MTREMNDMCFKRFACHAIFVALNRFFSHESRNVLELAVMSIAATVCHCSRYLRMKLCFSFRVCRLHISLSALNNFFRWVYSVRLAATAYNLADGLRAYSTRSRLDLRWRGQDNGKRNEARGLIFGISTYKRMTYSPWWSVVMETHFHAFSLKHQYFERFF